MVLYPTSQFDGYDCGSKTDDHVVASAADSDGRMTIGINTADNNKAR